MVELLVNHYHPRTLLQKVSLNLEGVLTDNQLWLCAWCYRCYRRCPQGLKLPEIFLLARRNATEKGILQGFNEAMTLVGSRIPLSAVSCWVCFHPERANIERQTIDKAIKGLALNYKLEEKKKSPRSRRLRGRVAIIGSGPAGLTAAHELVKKGYPVTVFESSSEPGGMLRRCIPEYRLPKEALNLEIDHLKKMGVEIKTNHTFGKDLTLASLKRDGYKAVFIAIGAHKSGKLHVEGEQLKGVIDALDFLQNVNQGKKIRLGRRVAVIGGGNVAMDAARTALRHGAKEVCILYRRTKEEMPANPWEIQEAEKEGVKIQFLLAPKKILGKDGHVTGMECLRMELGETDETGRRRPVPVEGSELVTEWDMIILAIGETPDLSNLPKEIETADGKTIIVDPVTMETSLPGVFAGGDVVSGPATVIEAIAAGKRAAIAIERYLRGETVRTGEKKVKKK